MADKINAKGILQKYKPNRATTDQTWTIKLGKKTPKMNPKETAPRVRWVERAYLRDVLS